jgi:hypothetical protein
MHDARFLEAYERCPDPTWAPNNWIPCLATPLAQPSPAAARCIPAGPTPAWIFAGAELEGGRIVSVSERAGVAVIAGDDGSAEVDLLDLPYAWQPLRRRCVRCAEDADVDCIEVSPGAFVHVDEDGERVELDHQAEVQPPARRPLPARKARA